MSYIFKHIVPILNSETFIQNEVFNEMTLKPIDEAIDNINSVDIVDDLTTGGSDKALSAEQGKKLKGEIDNIKEAYLLNDLDLYVSTTGNDITGDGTSSKPFRTIQKTINSCPKNLNGFKVIFNIAAGDYSEIPKITSFGNGSCVFLFTGDANFKGLDIVDNSVAISFKTSLSSCTINFLDSTASTIRNIVSIINSSLTCFDGINISITGKYPAYNDNALYIYMGNFTNTSINNILFIDNSYRGIYSSGSNCALGVLNGSNNFYGIVSALGSKITYQTNSITATTREFTGSGGRIYAGSQTSVPNY